MKSSTSDGQVLGTFSDGINHPHGIHYAFGYILVANWFGNDITKLNPYDGQNLGNFLVGTHPSDINSDDTNLWVSNFDDNFDSDGVRATRAATRLSGLTLQILVS